MKEKLLAIYAKVKELIGKAYVASPFLFGMACGYFGKPIIQFAVSLAAKAVKYLVS